MKKMLISVLLITMNITLCLQYKKIGNPYQIRGKWYFPHEDPYYDEIGIASWYGDQDHGKPTAIGEIFNENKISAAHKTLPLPCIVQVKNLDNGRSLKIRVNDRGPFVDGRIIDLSKAAAQKLGFKELAKVRVTFDKYATEKMLKNEKV